MRKLHCSLMSSSLLIGLESLAGTSIPQSHYSKHHLFSKLCGGQMPDLPGVCSGRAEMPMSAAKSSM
jgi:hypothetical protein